MVRAQGRRATRLRYAPTSNAIFILVHIPALRLLQTRCENYGAVL